LLASENVVEGSLKDLEVYDKDGTGLWSINILKIPLNK